MTKYEYYKMKYCQLKIKRREAERISGEIYAIQKELDKCDEATSKSHKRSADNPKRKQSKYLTL